MESSSKNALQKQTLESFDYQWRNIPEGHAQLNDAFFFDNVEKIIAEQELRIDPAWFKGKTVLDAGCGNGRWSYGFNKLGAKVTSIDYSEAGCGITRRVVSGFKDAEVIRADILNLPPEIASRKFDLVFSWGVLHHTGKTRDAFDKLSKLVKDDGVMYVYLYGKSPLFKRFAVTLLRSALSPFNFDNKKKILQFVLRDKRRVHNLFDKFSPKINNTYTFNEVRKWFREDGFSDVTQTIEWSEVFARGCRENCSARKYFKPAASRPYWFEQYVKSSS